MPANLPNHGKLTFNVGDVAFDCMGKNLSIKPEAPASYYVLDGGRWLLIDRFAYDLLLEIGRDVRVMRVE